MEEIVQLVFSTQFIFDMIFSEIIEYSGYNIC